MHPPFGAGRLSCFLRHPWSHVVIGMWHKYPNSKCTHVVSIDTIDRSVDSQTGIIRTERVLGCKQKAPMWIVKVSFIQMLLKLVSQQTHMVSSYLEAQKMRSSEKFLLSIQPPKMSPSPPLTSPSHNSQPATSKYITHPLLPPRPLFCKQPRSRLEWHYGVRQRMV